MCATMYLFSDPVTYIVPCLLTVNMKIIYCSLPPNSEHENIIYCSLPPNSEHEYCSLPPNSEHEKYILFLAS